MSENLTFEFGLSWLIRFAPRDDKEYIVDPTNRACKCLLEFNAAISYIRLMEAHHIVNRPLLPVTGPYTEYGLVISQELFGLEMRCMSLMLQYADYMAVANRNHFIQIKIISRAKQVKPYSKE